MRPQRTIPPFKFWQVPEMTFTRFMLLLLLALPQYSVGAAEGAAEGEGEVEAEAEAEG